MSDSFSVRPPGGVAGTWQPAGSHAASRPPDAPGANEARGAGPDFLLELGNQNREEPQRLPQNQNNSYGREKDGARNDAQTSSLGEGARPDAAATAKNSSGATAEAQNLTGAAQGAVNAGGAGADGARAEAAVNNAAINSAAASVGDAGQNLPPHAGSIKVETRGAGVAAAYKAVQDRARQSTSLAPWGTGISYVV